MEVYMSRCAKRPAPLAPNSYDRLFDRITRQVTSPVARLARQATIRKRNDEPQEAWDLLLEQISLEDLVCMEKQSDGSVFLFWRESYGE